VRRAFIGIVALLVLVSLGAVAYGAGVVPGTRDCVWRSVDEREYVRANEAVLESVPLSPRLRRAHATTWTHALSAPNGCLPLENGPPYNAFITTHVFVRQTGEPPLGYDPTLLGREWVRQNGLTRDVTYRKGSALLIVTNSDEGVLLRVDHRAYGP
jgi:hypothetical protein